MLMSELTCSKLFADEYTITDFFNVSDITFERTYVCQISLKAPFYQYIKIFVIIAMASCVMKIYSSVE